MEWTNEKLNELYAVIRKKAVTDEEYRQELLENPNAVIEKEIGEKLPEGFKVNVIENDPAYSATFVLPDMLGEEVDTDNLDDVAGGVVSIVLVLSACAAAVGINLCAADACAAKASVVVK